MAGCGDPAYFDMPSRVTQTVDGIELQVDTPRVLRPRLQPIVYMIFVVSTDSRAVAVLDAELRSAAGTVRADVPTLNIGPHIMRKRLPIYWVLPDQPTRFLGNAYTMVIPSAG